MTKSLSVLTFFLLFISLQSKSQDTTNVLDEDSAFAKKFSIEEYFNTEITDEERNKFKSEVEKLTVYIEKQPEDYRGYLNRGAYFSYLGFYVNAIKDYDKAIELNDSVPEAYYNRGVAKARFIYTLDSCEDFKKAHELGLPQAGEVLVSSCGRYKKFLKIE